MADHDESGWLCGAFQPTQDPFMGYRCTEPYGHLPRNRHRAVIDGEVVAEWTTHTLGPADE
jgi:hypothetical protein